MWYSEFKNKPFYKPRVYNKKYEDEIDTLQKAYCAFIFFVT